jgi:hypothetical protein
VIEIIGDQDAGVCVDGVCAVPRPEDKPQDAEPPASADARPGDVAPVQR